MITSKVYICPVTEWGLKVFRDSTQYSEYAYDRRRTLKKKETFLYSTIKNSY